MPLPISLLFRFINRKQKSYSQHQVLNQALLKVWWILPKGLHRELAGCWISKFTERIMPKPLFSEDCATKSTRKRNGDEGCRKQILSSQRRKSRKNAHFRPQICTFASDNSERSLAIQNNVPQSTPLISKSLPIHLSPKGNTLLLSKIVRRQKID